MKPTFVLMALPIAGLTLLVAFIFGHAFGTWAADAGRLALIALAALAGFVANQLLGDALFRAIWRRNRGLPPQPRLPDASVRTARWMRGSMAATVLFGAITGYVRAGGLA